TKKVPHPVSSKFALLQFLSYHDCRYYQIPEDDKTEIQSNDTVMALCQSGHRHFMTLSICKYSYSL
ncbi:MAG: hypothetical protein IKS51_00560, partial [Erysipelotrichaceae bacterium]|nr:hypothetical protein [Erysipelotrichaceae bacterium]